MLWTDYEAMLSQIALYPINIINHTINKNAFILNLSLTEVVKMLAYYRLLTL